MAKIVRTLTLLGVAFLVGSGACSDNEEDCGGGTVDLDTSHDNCGACGKKCAALEKCSEGACSCITSCDGKCVDLQTDAKNCGACGTVCPGFAACIAGVCTC